MSHLRTGPSFKALVFHLSVFLVQTGCCGAETRVIGPQRVMAALGDDIILPCHLEPPMDAVSMTLEWARPDLSPRFVFVWHKGLEHLINKHQSYKGRTSVSIEELKHGNVSLKISQVTLSDEGTYRCHIPNLDMHANIELAIGSVSSPVISLVGITKSLSGVVLACEANGWYPEPEVSWLDGEGRVLSAGHTETVRGPDGLYTVSSRVTVEKIHSNTFTCSLRHKHSNQTRDAQIYVQDGFPVVSCSASAHLTVSLVVCFAFSLTVFFVVWKWRQNEIKNREQELNEREQLINKTAEIKDLKTKLRNVTEQLQKTEEDVMKTLQDQEDGLKKLRNELSDQMEEMNKLIMENEKKIKPVDEEMKKEGDKTEIKARGFSKLRTIIAENQRRLDETQNKHDGLQTETETLLETTRRVLSKVMEKKKEVEDDKEQT